MNVDKDVIIRKLSEWKEKILFGCVLLAALYVARNATVLGGGIDVIDREARTSAMSGAGVDETTGMRALDRLQKPPDISPTPPDPAEINSLFYDERDDLNTILRRHGVLCVEMETAELYHLCARYGVRGLGVLTISDHLLTHEALPAADREQSFGGMIEIALGAAFS